MYACMYVFMYVFVWRVRLFVGGWMADVGGVWYTE